MEREAVLDGQMLRSWKMHLEYINKKNCDVLLGDRMRIWWPDALNYGEIQIHFHLMASKKRISFVKLHTGRVRRRGSSV